MSYVFIAIQHSFKMAIGNLHLRMSSFDFCKDRNKE